MTCPLPEHALGLGTSEQLPTPRPVLLQGPAPRWQSPFSKAQGHGWDGGAGVERRGRSQPLLLAPPCPSRELWPSESWGLILAFEML